ncbi:MAG: hypothetical protein VX670_12240, partial [Candidatus Latescibacterota bacterium]|nr:hypothetical protein [Candidatus Latescibacterota bacterium]
RLQKEVTDEEIAALVATLKEAKRDLETANDRGKLNDAMGKHLSELFAREQEASGKDLTEGTAPTEAWDASFEFLSRRMEGVLKAKRELGWELEERREAIAKLEHQIGDARRGALRPVVDVLVETAGITGGAWSRRNRVAPSEPGLGPAPIRQWNRHLGSGPRGTWARC